jgi:hypothetical protein
MKKLSKFVSSFKSLKTVFLIIIYKGSDQKQNRIYIYGLRQHTIKKQTFSQTKRNNKWLMFSIFQVNWDSIRPDSELYVSASIL